MTTRRERVIVEAVDNYSGELGRMAGATRLFRQELDRSSRGLGSYGSAVRGMEADTARVGKEVDRTSGRLRLLGDALLTVGPAGIPIASVLVPALSGLASQAGAAVLAGGTLLTAFQGVGEGLEAVNTAALEPTAENLEAARIAMGNLGPEARELVRTVQEMRPAFLGLRDAAAAGGFPGLVEGLDELDGVLPQVEDVLFRIGDATGQLGADLGEALSSERGREFLTFIGQEVPGVISDLGSIIGNLAAGAAELWRAFTPLNNDFSDWMVDVARSFDDWAAGLSRTQGFEEFVNYIRENGPRVADALGAIGDAVLQIIQAAAPLGGPTLIALEAVAEAIAAIAGSDAGPAIFATATALTLLSRASRGLNAVQGSSWFTNTRNSLTGMRSSLVAVRAAQDDLARSARSAATAQTALIPTADKRAALSGYAAATQRLATAERERSAALRGGLGTIGKAAGVAGGLAIATSGVADKMGLANTATLGLMGSLAGPWGIAVGGAVGLAMDIAGAQSSAAASAEDLLGTLNQQTGALTANTRAMVASKLESEGILKAAGDLGLNLADVTDAATGNQDALSRVNAELDRYSSSAAASASVTNAYGMRTSNTEARDLANSANQVRDALSGQNSEVQEAVGSHGRLSEATRSTAASQRQAVSAAQALRNSLTNLSAALDQRASLRDYEAALDDFYSTLRKTGNAARLLNKDGSINIDLPKGRELEARLDGIASAAINVADNFGPLRKARILNQAREDVIEAARAMEMPKAAIRDLLRDLGLLNRQNARPKVKLEPGNTSAEMAGIDGKLKGLDAYTANPNINVDTGNAAGAVQSVESWLNSIQDEIVYVNVQRRQLGGVQKYSSGGYTGNLPATAIAGAVHGREVVIPAALARQDARWLKERYGHLPNMNKLPGYAEGGYVAPRQPVAMTPSAGPRTRVSVSMDGMRVSGTLATPWGPAEIDGIAVRAANRVVNAQLDHDHMMGGSR